MNLILDGSAVDHDRVGYLFGLLAQCVHFIRLKSNFITDLAARFILKYPAEMPKTVVCGFEDSGQLSLGSIFTFSAPEIEVGEDVDLFREIVDVSQALAAASIITEDMELEGRILVYTRQEDAVAKGKSLLVTMFERFGANQESSSCFDQMISTLVNKLSIVSLTWLVLLMSHDMLQLPGVIKQVDVNDLNAKDLPKTLIVQDSTGELKCLSVSVATKSALWVVLIEVLVKVFGDGIKGVFDRMLEEGEKILLNDEKKSKRKRRPSQFDFLEAFANARVSYS